MKWLIGIAVGDATVLTVLPLKSLVLDIGGGLGMALIKNRTIQPDKMNQEIEKVRNKIMG